MAKNNNFEQPYETTQAMYTQAIVEADLNGKVVITVLTDNRAKEIFKVSKANKLLQYRAGDDVIIVINEKILEQLEPAQQLIVVEESIAGISFDSENDVLEVKGPTVKTFKGILRKHTYETWNVVQESIETLYQVEKNEEQARKDALAAGKPKKKF